jgi:hypothetical protein
VLYSRGYHGRTWYVLLAANLLQICRLYHRRACSEICEMIEDRREKINKLHNMTLCVKLLSTNGCSAASKMQ